MADTGALYPTASSQVEEAPWENGGVEWQNITNAYADDGANAYYTSNYCDTGEYSRVLRLVDFDAAVPVDATVDGIKVEIEWSTATPAASDDLVQLTKDGAVRVGSNYSKDTQVPTAPTIWTYGGVADLWGTTWTPAEVNAATFGVHIAMYATVDNARWALDYARITIYYTEAGGPAGTARSWAMWL